MYCDQAKELFNAYLDGDLSPSMERELAAHRVRCEDCRRELALLEVSGRLIQSDDEPVALDDGFTDRLLACVDASPLRSASHWRARLYWAVPLAAAAVVTLAFLGAFDRGPAEYKVAGRKERSSISQPGAVVVAESAEVSTDDEAAVSAKDDAAQRALEDLVRRIGTNVSSNREHVETLRDSLDLTVRQWLDVLNSRKNPEAGERHVPGTEDLDSNGATTKPARRGEIEDL